MIAVLCVINLNIDLLIVKFLLITLHNNDLRQWNVWGGATPVSHQSIVTQEIVAINDGVWPAINHIIPCLLVYLFLHLLLNLEILSILYHLLILMLLTINPLYVWLTNPHLLWSILPLLMWNCYLRMGRGIELWHYSIRAVTWHWSKATLLKS